jgi:mannose-6-phosphate isomerase-like protein (cupin superfamily)
MSRTGQTLVDIREATVTVLADRPELVMTHARIQTEGGPPVHVHRRHADGFVVLDGELDVHAGGEQGELGAGMVWVAPPGTTHGYRHEGTDEAVFLNFHTPGMGFAEYLFGQRRPDEVDQFEPPADGGGGGALVLRIEDGETITDTPERTVRILADLPELVLTWTRYVSGEEGPGPHIHREHVDAFYMLSGELVFRVGPELERVVAGPNTFVLAPPEVVHSFRNEGPEEATWLNFHAPSAGFARALREPGASWDSFDAPVDGGRPFAEAIIHKI